MKKLLSIILIASMLCPVFAGTAAEAKTSAEAALNFLEAVGFDTGFDEETIDSTKKVTRAVFADNMVKLLKLDDLKTDNVYYHDVSRDHWAFNSVGIMTEQGYLKGDGQSAFYPEEIIDKAQAVRLMVSALGYDQQAVALGGWYKGYQKIANELELLDGCSAESDLTYTDMYIMFENTLKTNLTEIASSKGEIGFAKSDETFLGKYYGMYYEKKGILTGCDGVSLTKTTELSDGYAEIDGLEYTTVLTDLINHIGTEIEFIYKADSADDEDRELVWAESTGKTKTFDLEKKPSDSFDAENHTLKYSAENGGTLKRLKLSTGMIIIYNGALYEGKSSELLNLPRYQAHFIQEKGSTEYDIAVLQHYENLVVGSIDTYDNVIYDKFDQSKSLSVDEDKRDKVTFSGGKTIEDIQVGDVLSYYETKDGKKLKVVVTSQKKSGSIKNISKDDEQVFVTLEDEEIELYDLNTEVTFSLKDMADVYLDCNGYAAYVKKLAADVSVTYIIQVKYDEDNDRMTIKYLGQDGTIYKKNCRDKVRMDGKAYKAQSEAADIFLDSYGKTIQQVAILTVDENDAISKIDTVTRGDNEEADATLRFTGSYPLSWYKFFGKLGQTTMINGETIIFSVPSEAGEDEEYQVKRMSNLSNDKWYSFDAYRYNEDGETYYEEILVMKDRTWDDSAGAILVDKISAALDSDDMPVEELVGYNRGTEVTLVSDGEYSFKASGISQGDIISPTYSLTGKVKNAKILFDYDADLRPIDDFSSTYNNGGRVITGYANSIVNGVIRIGYSSGADFDEIFLIPEKYIIVFDSDESKKVRAGSFTDIKTYDIFGNSCSTVFITTTGAEVMSAIVYK